MANPKRKRDEPTMAGAVPKAVISRLSLYLRELQHLVDAGRETISSGDLGRLLGFTDAQVRKDLAYFGQFGYPGIGYRTGELIDAIRGILGTDRVWKVAIVGIGNLGQALLGHKGFAKQGFEIAAAFDADPAKIGSGIKGIEVQAIDTLPDAVHQHRIRLGMIAVPPAAAQGVADRMVAAGIEGIVNFAPVTISLPEHVTQIGVDLAIELEQIAFAVVSRSRER